MSITEEETPQASETVISPLQEQAWKVLNASFHEPDADALRERGRALYEEDLRNRLSKLLARLDQQNAHLDTLLAGKDEKGGE